jgi:hypothetical protein
MPDKTKEIADTWEKIYQLTSFPVTNRGIRSVGELADRLEAMAAKGIEDSST